MANTYIYLPGSGNGGPGGVKFTYSVWFKLAKDSGDSGLVSTNPGGQQSWDLWVNPFVKFKCYESTSLIGQLVTNAKLRDIGAWYNIVVNIDFANVTEDQRMKLWINGVQQTGSMLSAETYPSTSGTVDSGGSVFNIGRYQASSDYFKGSMSNIHFYDGYAYDASDFGEFDSTSGIWKIKTTGPSATYGTYGFNVKMEDRTNLDLDSSSNALAFTTGGTLTATYDNPSNNFCTANPLQHSGGNYTFSNGNTTVADNAGSSWRSSLCTLGAAKGKFYFEARVKTAGSYRGIGVMNPSYSSAHNEGFMDKAGGWGYNGNGNKETGDVETSYGNTYTATDHIGCAYDVTNGVIWFSKNGVWQNSATIAEINAGTTTNAAFSDIPTGNLMQPAIQTYTSAAWEWNFGNGYFGDVAITSAGTNASGNGDFEYDVPTGYTAWCTKGINSF